VIRLLAVCVTAAYLSVSVIACGGGSESSARTPAQATPDTAESVPNGEEISAADFDRRLFDDTSATITNQWVRFEPGRRWTWRGWTEEDGERIPHRIVFTVTDMTKVIDGVRGVVGWERDFSSGRLIESELIFFAQDKRGNVWHLGQYSETYEDREFVGGSAWLVGNLKGAKAGLFMHAQPRRGTRAYSQGFAPPPYYWDDWGKVYRTGQRTCVPAGCYRNVVIIDEFEPTKPGAHQLKYYARGVGNVRVGWRGTDADKEVLVLSKAEKLGERELARARQAVREHEARANVYGRTQPAQ